MIYSTAGGITVQFDTITNISVAGFGAHIIPTTVWSEGITTSVGTTMSSVSALSNLYLSRTEGISFNTFGYYSCDEVSTASWSNAIYYYPPEGSVWYIAPFTAQRIEDAKSARQSIDEFGVLSENWDGYGASPISDNVQRNAKHFLDMIEVSPNPLSIPETSATPSGTIAFEWESDDTIAYLEVGNTRFSGYIRSDRRPPTFLQGRMEDLDQRIVGSIQRAFSPTFTPSPLVTEIHTQARQYERLAA
jgi:hypothetical protein